VTDPLKIQPIEPCGAIGKCMGHPSSYAAGLSSYSKPTPERVATHALQQLEAARQRDIDTHEANLPKLAINEQVVAQVSALMDSIGMPKRWSERDLKSRARYPKSVTHDAGYLTDLRREARTTDGFDHATSTYERLRKDYHAYAEQAKRETEQQRAAEEREREAVIERRKADMELAALLVRYALPPESDWDDVLEALRGRDQRLDLAVAMQQTRGDWSEGPYRVRNALGRFQITSTEDKDIANDVLACLDDFEDGRVFRDTTWNYGRLFAEAADAQLATDIQLCCQRSRDN
jgi:hypothetical protein